MLTCIARSNSKQQDDNYSKNNHHSTKSLTSQFKDMALKAAGAYKNCAPCTSTPSRYPTNSAESEVDSDKFRWSYKRTTSMCSSSTETPRTWGKEMEARLRGMSSTGDSTPDSVSDRRVDGVVFVEESEPKEWVAQVEPGVLITFVSLPRGGNDLRRIKFSREMFNKWQAQKWWTENYDRIVELYNVQRLHRQAFPLQTPPPADDEGLKPGSVEDSLVTPPLTRECLPRIMYRPTWMGMVYSSSDSLDHHSVQPHHHRESNGLSSIPNLSSISGAKTETSSIDASVRSSSSRGDDRFGELSISNASNLESEWVEQDEPGVYITISALPGCKRELKRVRFS